MWGYPCYGSLITALALFLRHYTLKQQVILEGEPNGEKLTGSPEKAETPPVEEVESKENEGETRDGTQEV